MNENKLKPILQETRNKNLTRLVFFLETSFNFIVLTHFLSHLFATETTWYVILFHAKTSSNYDSLKMKVIIHVIA